MDGPAGRFRLSLRQSAGMEADGVPVCGAQGAAHKLRHHQYMLAAMQCVCFLGDGGDILVFCRMEFGIVQELVLRLARVVS